MSNKNPYKRKSVAKAVLPQAEVEKKAPPGVVSTVISQAPTYGPIPSIPANLEQFATNGTGSNQKMSGSSAVYAYGVTLLLMAVIFNVLWTYARRDRRLISEDFPQSKVRAVTQACAVGMPLTGLIPLLATWTPLGGVIFAFSISAFYLPGVTLFDRD